MSIDINSAWNELKQKVSNCRKCGLCNTRKNTVFGEGPINCKCVIIGEGPGADEDEQGKPFVGKAGQLLTNILQNGGGIPRHTVYIMNVVKCHPLGDTSTNRPPNQDEIEACKEYLEAQLALLHPEIVVTMGNTPTQYFFGKDSRITQMRGQWLNKRGIIFFPMFHPSYLLRNLSNAENSPRYLTWRDVQALSHKLREIEKN